MTPTDVVGVEVEVVLVIDDTETSVVVVADEGVPGPRGPAGPAGPAADLTALLALVADLTARVQALELANARRGYGVNYGNNFGGL